MARGFRGGSAGCTGAGATGSTGGPDATAEIEGGGEDARVADDAIASESSDAAAAIEGGGEDARVADDATAPDSSDAAEGGSGVVDASADFGALRSGVSRIAIGAKRSDVSLGVWFGRCVPLGSQARRARGRGA